jgi:hypothetical protein
VIWFFRPGTEDRVEVLEMINEGDSHYGIPCQNCGIHFTLRAEHGVTIGADGAISTVHSFNCPKCMGWHAMFHGGVVVPC